MVSVSHTTTVASMLAVLSLQLTPTVVHAGFTSESFVQNEAASIYNGDPLQVDFVMTLSSDWGMEMLFSLEPLVVRLAPDQSRNPRGAIEFHPHFHVMDGRPYCHPRDADGNPVAVTDRHVLQKCQDHCLNNGRYCDPFSWAYDYGDHKIHHKRSRYVDPHFQLPGYKRIEEVARRLCVWQEYGAAAPLMYFQYHHTLQGLACDLSLTHDCVEQTLVLSHMDMGKIDTCMNAGNGLGQDLDVDNSLLEQEIQNTQTFAVQEASHGPNLFVNGNDLQHRSFYASINLQVICGSFPAGNEPAICAFCNEHCYNYRHHDYHAECLWELQCHDLTFEDFLKSQGENDTVIIDRETLPPNSDSNSDTDIGFYSNSLFGNDTNNQDQAGIAVLVLAALITAGGLLLALMALRVWRTKRIIERYVREQKKELAMANQPEHHQDIALFPQDNDLDWDLEPALQYRDHLGPTTTRPTGPASSSFLPRIS